MHPVAADRRGLLLYLLAWLLLGALLALPALGAELAAWREAVTLFLPPYLLYAFLCLAAWYPCRANPIPDTGPMRLIAVHLSAGVASSLLWWAASGLWADLLGRLFPIAAWGPLRPEAPRFLALGMLLYLLVASVHYLLLAFEASRRARQRSLELRVLAREAELAAFKSQIDPHFLFNCLNSISSLCGSDPQAARQMSIRLGEFLRASLKLAERDFIELGEEVDLARAYLEIERVRFGDRLAFEDTIESDVTACKVPALVLQPLLENAVKHGLAHLVEGGLISLTAATRGERLRLSVRNPVDTDARPSSGNGIGLANVSGRLDLLYDHRAKLEIDRHPGQFEVTLDLPKTTETRETTG
jgi:hypothetical protein